MGNVAKINRASPSQGTVQNSNAANRFELLADTSDEIPSAVLDTDKKSEAASALYSREKLQQPCQYNSFHVIPLTKGDIHETKVQVKCEESFRKLTELLDAKKNNYYTYQ